MILKISPVVTEINIYDDRHGSGLLCVSPLVVGWWCRGSRRTAGASAAPTSSSFSVSWLQPTLLLAPEYAPALQKCLWKGASVPVSPLSLQGQTEGKFGQACWDKAFRTYINYFINTHSYLKSEILFFLIKLKISSKENILLYVLYLGRSVWYSLTQNKTLNVSNVYSWKFIEQALVYFIRVAVKK